MRSTLVLAATGLLATLSLSACGGQQGGEDTGVDAAESSCDAGSGRVNIATGNSTGVYFVVGGGLAKQINAETDLQASSAETGASVQNIEQLVAGDYDIAFSLADTAADAVAGDGAFDEAQDISSLGRIYPNYTQVVVRKDSGIKTIADFEGKTISTGSPLSGTEVIATRLIEAAGLTIDDISAQRLDLTKTIDGIKDGSIDALVWSGGLPTPALTDLFTAIGDQVEMIDPTTEIEAIKKISPTYEEAVIPAATYGLPADLPSIRVANHLLVRDDMRDNVACALTSLVFGQTDDLIAVHPAAADITTEDGPDTDPVSLHPGSARAFDDELG